MIDVGKSPDADAGTSSAENEPLGTKSSEVEVRSIKLLSKTGSVRAFVDIEVQGILMRKLRIIQENGKAPWVPIPVLTYETQYGTPDYKPSVQITDERLKNQIYQTVLKHGRTEKEVNR